MATNAAEGSRLSEPKMARFGIEADLDIPRARAASTFSVRASANNVCEGTSWSGARDSPLGTDSKGRQRFAGGSKEGASYLHT